MDTPLAWIAVPIVLFAVLLKRVPVSTLLYYVHLVVFGLVVQLGFLLPFFYFPFRPFDYRNAK